MQTHTDFSLRFHSWQRTELARDSRTLEGPAGPSYEAASLTVLTPLDIERRWPWL